MSSTTLRGVNLDGWLVLQPWVTPELFAATGAMNEADLIKSLGVAEYHKAVTEHRETFITRNDFSQMIARGFNAVRIQIPWYILGGDNHLIGDYLSSIEYLDNAFDWADELGIKIILDICQIPGYEDTNDGISMYVELGPRQKELLLDVLAGLCKRYRMRQSFWGIEPLGQIKAHKRGGFSFVKGLPLHKLRTFYREAYDVIRTSAGRETTVVLSDAGYPDAWRWFMAHSKYENVWLDTHSYHFNEQMDVSGPQGVKSLLDETRRAISQAQKSGLPVMIGEWCAALPIADSSLTPEGRIALERYYVAGQMTAFEQCKGWFFQTWKTSSYIANWDARIALSSFERGMFD